MSNIKFGAGVASCCGYGSTKVMRILGAPGGATMYGTYILLVLVCVVFFFIAAELLSYRYLLNKKPTFKKYRTYGRTIMVGLIFILIFLW
jgi:hypothetical protein